MSKLNNNFTTTEQSKRLLELGVPVDSADLIQVQDAITTDEYIMVRNEDEPIGEFIENNQDILPCWSVGRLIELYMKAKGLDFMYFRIMSDADMIDSIIRMFVENQNEMDFSKLEE